MSRDYLARIETARDNPSLGILTKIAGGLQMSIPELLSGTEERVFKADERISAILSSLKEEDSEFLLKQLKEWALFIAKKDRH